MANQTVENNDEMCLFKEVEGDLFSCPYRSSMAVSVSEEFKMGRGIAVMFKKRFGHVDDLWNQDKRVGQVAILKDHERYIYYLITKQNFYDKPNYDSLGWSLVDMRNHCVQHGVKELAMPRIGCGLDLLEWAEVSAMIKEIFAGTGISITIYNWVDKEEKQEVVNKAPNFRHMELKEKGQPMSGMGSASSRTYIPGLPEQAQPKKKKKRKKNKNRGNTHAEDVNGDDGDDDNEQQSDRPLQKSNFNSQERTQGLVDPSENRGKWDRRPTVAEEDSFIVFSDEPENWASRTPHSKAKSMDDDDKQLLPDVPENWDTTEASGISDGQKNELAQEDQHVIKDGKRTSNDSKPNLEPKSKSQRIKGKDTKTLNEEWKAVGDKKPPNEIKEGRKAASQLSCDGQVNRVEASTHPSPDSSRHKVERDQADNQTNPIDQVEKPKSAAQQPISKVGEGNLQPSVNPENHNKDNSRKQQIRPSQAEKGKESGTSKPFGVSSTGKPTGRGRGSAGGQSGGKGQNKRVGGSGRELLLEVKVEVKVGLNLQTKEAVVLGSDVLRNQAEFVLPVSLHCNE